MLIPIYSVKMHNCIHAWLTGNICSGAARIDTNWLQILVNLQHYRYVKVGPVVMTKGFLQVIDWGRGKGAHLTLEIHPNV